MSAPVAAETPVRRPVPVRPEVLAPAGDWECAKAAVEKSLIWFDWTNVDVDDPQVTSVKEVAV